MINRRPVRDFVCSREGAAGLLELGGMSLLSESGQLMLSLIFRNFGIALRAIRGRKIPCLRRSRGKAIPFTAAPCYPYELASKNKPLGEFDGC
jgi:hypothetical protein